MKKLRSALLVFALTLCFASFAQAQATRTWVSGVGDDVNPCSRTAPCKTFAGAIAKTVTGGEISVLDPGGFGTIVISKSITIDGTGMLSSILASGVNGITINTTDVRDVAKSVRIRGLSINGAGTGIHGIRVLSATKVSVEDTVIDGFTKNGVQVETGAATVFVRNATIRNNAGAGVNVEAGAGRVGLTDVSLIFNGKGLAGAAGSITSFDHVVLYGNTSGDPAPPAAPVRKRP